MLKRWIGLGLALFVLPLTVAACVGAPVEDPEQGSDEAEDVGEAAQAASYCGNFLYTSTCRESASGYYNGPCGANKLTYKYWNCTQYNFTQGAYHNSCGAEQYSCSPVAYTCQQNCSWGTF